MSDLFANLKVKLEQTEYVKKYVSKLRKEYFILTQQTDISEAKADLEDTDERLVNIEIRL